MQCWALSTIPTIPGVFPCSSIYVNLDTLIGYTKESRMQEVNILMFPWLLWYIWKARNDLYFNAKNVAPLDTAQLARHEAEAWKVAQVVEDCIEEEMGIPDPVTNLGQTEEHEIASRWKCQIDASWKSTTEGVGVGFVLFEDERIILFGCKKYLLAASPLQAEAEGLCWAMKEISQHGFPQVKFESDFQQLVQILNKSDQWPAIELEVDEINSLHSEFSEFSLSYIARSANIRADCLAKTS